MNKTFFNEKEIVFYGFWTMVFKGRTPSYKSRIKQNKDYYGKVCIVSLSRA